MLSAFLTCLVCVLTLSHIGFGCTRRDRLPIPQEGFQNTGKGWGPWTAWSQCIASGTHECPYVLEKTRECVGKPEECPGVRVWRTPCDYNKCPAIFYHQNLKGNCDVSRPRKELYSLKYDANKPTMCGDTCNEWDSCLGFTYNFREAVCYFHTQGEWCAENTDSPKLLQQDGLISYSKKNPDKYLCDQSTCDFTAGNDASLLAKIQNFATDVECAKACDENEKCKSFLWGSVLGDIDIRPIKGNDNYRNCYLFAEGKCGTHMKHEIARYCYQQ